MLAANDSASRTRAIAFCGLSIALMAVGALVTVPLGPVPFTLQIFVATFILVALEPKLAFASIVGYVVLGAVGVPVFSAMRGGIGVLAGPTGGFIWGYILGFAAAIAVGSLLGRTADAAGPQGKPSRGEFVRGFVMALVYLACAYICGWFQLMIVLGTTPEAAFLTAVAPFIVVDVVKVAVAVPTALAVKHAVGQVRA